MIAKQIDVRSNIKKYFDIAYEGEPVFVPRKQARNVVIISEDEYNRLSRTARLKAYAGSLSQKMRMQSEYDNANVRLHNINKLSGIRAFKANWNGNGAPAFSSALIDRVEELISGLIKQPELFPTALSTIQLEYDNARRDHMEIEIGDSDMAEVFIAYYDGTEAFDKIRADAEDINKRVTKFYG